MAAERTVETDKTRALFQGTQDFVRGLLETHEVGEDFYLKSFPATSKTDVIVFQIGEHDPVAISMNRRGRKKLVTSPQAEQFFETLSLDREISPDTPRVVRDALWVVNSSTVGKSELCMDEAGDVLYSNRRHLPSVNKNKKIAAVAFGNIPMQAYEFDKKGRVIREENVVYSDGLVMPTDRVNSEARSNAGKRNSENINLDREPLLVFQSIGESEYIRIVHAVIERLSKDRGPKEAQVFLDSYLKELKEKDKTLARTIAESFRI